MKKVAKSSAIIEVMGGGGGGQRRFVRACSGKAFRDEIKQGVNRSL